MDQQVVVAPEEEKEKAGEQKDCQAGLDGFSC
jgi:hypothetical protein